MTNYLPLLIILVSFALSVCLTIWLRAMLAQRALLDQPNARSSHTIPVPRGGGWALVLVLIPGMLLTVTTQNNAAEFTGLISGAIILAAISWFDDRLSARGGAPALARLSTHILAACLGSLCFAPQEMIFGGALPFWLDRAVMIVGWAWFINLYNFMDGIDGITCAETVSLATGVSLVMSAANIMDPFADRLTLLLTGAALGFLALNWHPAKIFMGDIGSVTLGYLTGFLLLALAVKGHWAPALILPLYYLADSGLTLLKRILRREKFWQAHRQHFYQRAAQAVGRHDKVVIWTIMANVLLIGAALFSLKNTFVGLIVAILIVGILLWTMNRRQAE